MLEYNPKLNKKHLAPTAKKKKPDPQPAVIIERPGWVKKPTAKKAK